MARKRGESVGKAKRTPKSGKRKYECGRCFDCGGLYNRAICGPAGHAKLQRVPAGARGSPIVSVPLSWAGRVVKISLVEEDR